MKYLLLLTVVLGALYAGLQSGSWFPGSDSDIYLVAGRNLLVGRGYVFNGQPLAHYPPGWPMFLAMLMLVSTSFWWLYAVAKLLLIAAALLYYQLLLRVTTPVRAFLCMVVTATLWTWFRNGCVLYSESLFLFLFAIGLLLAHQIKEGHNQWWRIAAVGLLSALLVCTRWPGVIAAGALCLTPVSGQLRPRRTREWFCCVSAGVLAVVTFVGLYALTGSDALVGSRQSPSAWAADGGLQDDLGESGDSDAAGKVHSEPSSTAKIPLLPKRGVSTYLRRALNLGSWLSRFLWPMAQMGSSGPTPTLIFNVLGWPLFIFVFVYAFRRLKEGEWLWAGILIYVAFVQLRWWIPPGRYLLPFAPFVILALWSGFETSLEALASKYPSVSARLRKRLSAGLVVFLLACNAGPYVIAAYVQRSRDFYAVWRAGQCVELVEAGRYLSEQAPADVRIAVTKQYRNLGRPHGRWLSMAGLALLTDRHVVMAAPGPQNAGPPDAQLIAWARDNSVSYYLHRPPTSPWRIWHFRVPWLQRWVTGETDIPHYPFWVLYRIDENGAEEVDTPEVKGWPTHVPPIVDERATSRPSD